MSFHQCLIPCRRPICFGYSWKVEVYNQKVSNGSTANARIVNTLKIHIEAVGEYIATR